ncbi:MAG: hypothetical protein HPY45_05155 [Anaerolineae bacterium]|nr:hypothetical protein [Anaerolineae bacterium]
MFAETDLRELVEFSSSEPVLSVYLNTDPTQGNADAYKLRLRNMLKNVNLPADVNAIERYFDLKHDWSGRSVAVFSCAVQKFFRAYPLALPVHDFIYIGNRPGVKPLINLWNNYGGYGVVLVDKQGARLFNFHLGQLVEQQGVLGETVKRTKRGGASSFPGRRGGIAGRTNAVDETVERNMKDVVDSAIRFFEENHIRRILISGSDDNVALFRSLLPKAWQSLVVGTFAMSMTASHNDVLNQTLQVGLGAEQQREKKLIDHMMTSAAKGGAAIVGLEDTLQAIYNDRVQTLVLAENFHQEGYRCTHCEWLTSLPAKLCSICGKEMTSVADVANLAISAVMRHAGDVEVVGTDESFEKVGSIGAILRY